MSQTRPDPTVDDLGLSNRAVNGLMNYLYHLPGRFSSGDNFEAVVRATTVAKLAEIDFQQLSYAKNLGMRSLAEICDAIALYGFKAKNCPHCEAVQRREHKQLLPSRIKLPWQRAPKGVNGGGYVAKIGAGELALYAFIENNGADWFNWCLTWDSEDYMMESDPRISGGSPSLKQAKLDVEGKAREVLRAMLQSLEAE